MTGLESVLPPLAMPATKVVGDTRRGVSRLLKDKDHRRAFEVLVQRAYTAAWKSHNDERTDEHFASSVAEVLSKQETTGAGARHELSRRLKRLFGLRHGPRFGHLGWSEVVNVVRDAIGESLTTTPPGMSKDAFASEIADEFGGAVRTVASANDAVGKYADSLLRLTAANDKVRSEYAQYNRAAGTAVAAAAASGAAAIVDGVDTNTNAVPDLLPVVGIWSAVAVAVALAAAFLVRGRPDQQTVLACLAPSLEDWVRNVLHAVEHDHTAVPALVEHFDDRLAPRADATTGLLEPFRRITDLLTDKIHGRPSFTADKLGAAADEALALIDRRRAGGPPGPPK